jgi:hypothetical protein
LLSKLLENFANSSEFLLGSLTAILLSREILIEMEEKLEGTFPYLDDVTVCGRNKEEHDLNLERFMTAVKNMISL